MPSAATRHAPSLCTNMADFMALRDEWNRLADDTDPGNVFLRHEWFAAAWAWRSRDARLCVVELRDRDRLVGLIPLVRWREAGLRHLGFLSVPDTQSCALLAAADAATEIATDFARALRTCLVDWDVLSLSYLADDAASTATLESALAAQGLKPIRQDGGHNPGIALTGSWQDYYSRRSRRLKKGNNLIANVLARHAQQPDLLHVGSRPMAANELDALLDTLIGVSAVSWKHNTGLTLDQPGPQAFIRNLSTAANDQGWLSVWLLKLNGRAVALEYQLRYRGAVHALRADYRADCAEFSPGTYLNWKMLERVLGGNDLAYWMGPGDNAYKQRWSETARPLTTLRAYNHTLPGYWRALRERQLRPLYHRMRTWLSSNRSTGTET